MINYSSVRILLIGLFLFGALSVWPQGDFDQKFREAAPSSLVQYTVTFTDSLSNRAELPILIIKGKEQGKTLTILAGVHGYEYPPIMAVQAFLKEVRPGGLRGNIIVLPISNTAAFYGRSPFINPQDGVNLNNAFPGKENGTVTQQIAYYISCGIVPITDVFLDLHGGDANEELIPFVCYYEHTGKAKETAMAEQLALNSGFTKVVSYAYTIRDNEPAKYAFKQAVQDGKVALSFEAGQLGNVQEGAVALHKNGIYNVLGKLDMYGTEPNVPKKYQIYNEQVYINAPINGIFYSGVRAGDRVAKGQKIGVITDAFGTLSATVMAPVSGMVLYKIGTPPR